MNANKRREDAAVATPAKRARQVCSYGEGCYRRNPLHLREYSHPHLESILDNYSGTGEFSIPENLKSQAHMIEEQLQIIREKNIYPPSNVDSSAMPSNTPATSREKNISAENTATVKTNESATRLQTDRKWTDTKTPSTVTAKNDSLKDAKQENSSNLVQENDGKLFSTSVRLTTSSARDLGHAEYRPIVEPTRRVGEYMKVVLPRGRSADKHGRSAPYHIFYTTITDAPDTHAQENSITFQELLDRSLGELRCSLQINFMVDIGWLLAQYYFAGYSGKRLTVLYGEETADIASVGRTHRNVDTHLVAMGSPFGKHHTKMMVLCYEDGSLRVVVSTANLYVDDWENRTQGLWWSPACPELPAGAMPHDGDSATGFKRSLLSYLEHYRSPSLAHYAERVRRCDMSHINVFLVASVPGSHRDSSWGMSRTGSLLQQHCRVPPRDTHAWPLVAQASSLGSYGKEPRLWLTGDFHSKFCRIREQSPLLSSTPPKLRIIYPSLENVQGSHDGLLGGGCLPYSAALHAKQPWLNQFLHQWRATSTGRDRAMPHIKSYLRASPDYKMAAYYLLTSANISKAAWGSVNKGDGALRIMSYEAGVLFLPQFVTGRDAFPLEGARGARLPLAYDLPPTPYAAGMTPWVMDYLHD